ncbi:unnamed protein product [Cladocopium goreaui]|uniref:C2H2-type domain-containing protein n=1 Tax=Cladocopium goreaui TaxID=2562237 RepID=A0A9P1FKV9_9DINO|nr:unnamed protein product [Cladocopium goreaui]
MDVGKKQLSDLRLSQRLRFFLTWTAIRCRATGRVGIGHWRCRNLIQVDREAIHELRGLVGRLSQNSGLPSIAYEGHTYTLVFRDFLEGHSCSAARWTMELLVAQLAAQRMENRQAVQPLALFFRPLGLSVFQALLWGSGASWAQVSRSGWGTFALLSSLARDFGRLLRRSPGQPEASRSFAEASKSYWPKKEMEDLAMEVPKMLELAIEHLQLVNRSANWDFESLSIHMETVEAVVRGWSRSAIIAGIHATTVISLLLLERQSEDFWRLVDEVLLPDAVELCLPQAVLGSEYDPSPCSQRHCRPLWGRDAALVAAAALRNASAVRIFRVEPRRRLLSDNLRSGCRVPQPQIWWVKSSAKMAE